jgi:hypothetical protein
MGRHRTVDILHPAWAIQKGGKGGSDQDYQYRTDMRIIMINMPRARRILSSLGIEL